MITQERLRLAATKLRTTSMPLADLIPLLQQAADELDRAHRVPEGWALVPIEPTPDQLRLGWSFLPSNFQTPWDHGLTKAREVYMAMLTTTPKPVVQPKPEQAEDETTECGHCCGKGWNDKWEAVAGHYEGGEYFKVECEHCDGTGKAGVTHLSVNESGQVRFGGRCEKHLRPKPCQQCVTEATASTIINNFWRKQPKD